MGGGGGQALFQKGRSVRRGELVNFLLDGGPSPPPPGGNPVIIIIFISIVKNYKHTKQNKQLNDNPRKKSGLKQSKYKVFFFPHNRIT